jgi:hypothetical protein
MRRAALVVAALAVLILGTRIGTQITRPDALLLIGGCVLVGAWAWRHGR